MAWINTVVSWLLAIGSFFQSAWFETSGWVWPFSWLSGIFYNIYRAFVYTASAFSNFSIWLEPIVARIGEILSSFDIFSLLRIWLEWAANAWNWVANAWNNVIGIVQQWWGTVIATIQGWIDIAIQGVQTLIAGIQSGLNSLRTSWDSFWTITFPTLANWTGVSSLIDSTLKTWFPFYDTLVILIDEIGDFFTDPLQWVYDKLDEFFERFW